MAQIIKYEKRGKKLYKVKNLYVGTNEKTGKKKYKSKANFQTKAAANNWINKTLVEAKENGVTDDHPEVKTFQDLYEIWFEYKKLTVSPSSLRTYNTIGKNILLPSFGHLKLDDIKVSYLQRYVQEWNKDYKSCVRFRRLASEIFSYGVSLEIINTNPMQKTILPKSNHSSTSMENFWTKEELSLFLNYLKEEADFKFYTFFHLLAYTGLRKGEALSLTWSDIDFDKLTLSVTKTLATDMKNILYISDQPKTKSSIRTISISNDTASILKSWRKKQLEFFLKLGKNTNQDSQLIFSNVKNKPHFPASISGTLNSLLKNFNSTNEIQLPTITPHGFRHTHTSLMLEAGVPVKEVSKRLGHTDIRMTLNIYTHISKDQEQKAADTFFDFMAN